MTGIESMSIRELLPARIKICGLRRAEDVRAVNRARPDYAGFVMTCSRRCVSLQDACGLIRLLDPLIRPVGVFGNENEADIAGIAAAAGMAVIQLHSPADPGRIARLRGLLAAAGRNSVLIWQSLALENPACDLESGVARMQLIESSGQPDTWLLDRCLPGQPGGTGLCLDWRQVAAAMGGRLFILAGGLSPDNVRQALAAARPWAVDCSSGVETEGWKDPAKILAFCRAVRSAASPAR
jgi:phosphoribosylanthranilate isomerase